MFTKLSRVPKCHDISFHLLLIIRSLSGLCLYHPRFYLVLPNDITAHGLATQSLNLHQDNQRPKDTGKLLLIYHIHHGYATDETHGSRVILVSYD